MTAQILTQSRLKELFCYNHLSGIFIFKERKITEFKDKRSYSTWNSKYCGKQAGWIMAEKYRAIQVNGKQYYAHRLAWLYAYGEFPVFHIDHLNHDRSDNRIKNLRQATRSMNQKNMSLHSRNKSGISGVNWRPEDKSWACYINHEGKRVFQKRFKSFYKAVAIRKALEVFYGYHENHGC